MAKLEQVLWREVVENGDIKYKEVEDDIAVAIIPGDS